MAGVSAYMVSVDTDYFRRGIFRAGNWDLKCMVSCVLIDVHTYLVVALHIFLVVPIGYQAKCAIHVL